MGGLILSNKKEQTKRKILKMALREIDENGYEKLSLRKLATNCNLTTGAFYRNFANKDALFMSLMLELSTSLTEIISQKSDGNYTPREKLLLLGENVFKLFNTKNNLVNFLFFNPVAQSIYTQDRGLQDLFPLLKSVHNLIDDIIRQESLELDSDETFIKIWAFLQGYMLLVRNGVTKFNAALLADTLSSLLTKKGI